MTILDRFVHGRSAATRSIYVVALCSMLFACGGGGSGSEPPPVSMGTTPSVTATAVPPTSLSCAGYPNTQQNYTQVCLLLPVEYAQVTPGVNVTSESGDITAHGTGPSDSYVVYTRVIAQAADQGTATTLAHSVVVTITPDGKISASPDHEDFPEMLRNDFEIFTLGSTNVTSNSTGGSLAADHYNATLNVTTVGGAIQLDTVQGNVTANTTGGDIQLDTVQGTVIAKTDGGALKLDTVNGNITATTGGGSIGITLTGTGWTGPGLNATTQGGSIVLTRPAAYQAALTAQTVSGTVSIDGQSVSPPTNPVKLTAGSGAPITLESQGGDVTVTVAQ